jgi:hypothetical protein
MMQEMMNEKTSKSTAADLEQLYSGADEVDKELFAEQRSNLLLISGEHYNKNRSSFYKRLRNASSVSNEQKIRLTKNHIGKINDAWVNHIVSTAPGVGFEAANDSELSDQKAAELNHSVWEFARNKHHMDEWVHERAEDFVGIGEVATKIFWDQNVGEYKGDGPDGPVFSGDFVFEEVFGFNLLRDPAAKNWKDCRYGIIRKMVKTKDLKKMYPDQAQKIQSSADGTYTIFDQGKGGYQKSKDECLVKEYYYRPCVEYPHGYFYIAVKEAILAEGELPAGKFPIVFAKLRRKQTSPRGTSIVKTLRPYQAEINRAASKMAEHQITLGDDKLLIQNGTKVTAGAGLPGVRSVNYTGMTPTILQGRDGSQYLNYMNSQIAEMYTVAYVEEKPENSGQIDSYTLLFRSAAQKKQFQIYIKRFEGFLKEVVETYLELARYHLPDDALIGMIGRKEQVNIPEFKSTTPLCYKLKITAQSDDIETKMGKQLVLNHILQYVGPQLDKESIGKVIKAMPYSNIDESFNDLLIDYEAATNDILALDRGDTPPIGKHDTHEYMIKRLTQRMRQADFPFLEPMIQQNYAMKLAAHEQTMAQNLKEIQMAESGLIPTGGYLVACDMYVPVDPKDPSKTKRVRVPYLSLQWLVEKMASQGASLEVLETMQQGNLVDMARNLNADGSAKPAQGVSDANGIESSNPPNYGTNQ